MNVVAVLFGWPAVVLALAIAVAAFVRGSWRLFAAAALMATAPLAYFAGTPRFGLAAPAVWLCCAASVIAARRGRDALAGALWLPYLALVGTVMVLLARERNVLPG